MSAKLVGAIWDLDLPHPQLWVLMAFADHADHTGGDIYASIALIVWKTGYSESQVHRIVRELVDADVLVRENRKPGGRGHPNRYRIDLDAAPRKALFLGEKGVTLTPFKGSHNDTLSEPKRVSPEAEKGVKRVSGLTRAPKYPRTLEPIEAERARTNGAITPAQHAKVESVQAELTERRLPDVLTGRDKQRIAECEADPTTIVDAYEALRAGQWGDVWCRTNVNPGVAAANISTYLGSRGTGGGNPSMSAAESVQRELTQEWNKLLGNDTGPEGPDLRHLPGGI